MFHHEHVGIGGKRTRARTEHGPALSHMIELHDALCHLKGVVIGQGGDTGAEHDPMGPLPGCCEKHFGAGDHFPTR